MASIASDILSATKTLLESLYDTIPVFIQKGEPGPDPASELAGWRPGLPTTCFVVSCAGPEEVSGMSSFEEIFVKYPVYITFVQPTAQDPGRWDDIPGVREKRQTIRGAFYGKQFTALRPNTFDVRVRAGNVYKLLDVKPLLVASIEIIDFQTYESRGA